jgi:type IV pilus assembly protein PilM
LAAEPLIGLDIGSMSIRAVETRRAKAGPVILNSGQVPLPAGAVKGGVIIDEALVTTTLKQLWGTTRLRSRKVVLGITNRQVVVREMSVSNLPERELKASLPLQVRHALPLAVESSLLDFYPLEDPGDAKMVRGLLIAAPKEAVLTAVHATERAGLHVIRVDLASFALLRAASRLDGVVEAIVDIGARTTTVVVHSDGQPVIVRTIPRGGEEITDVIAARLGVPEAEAEALKCQVGLLSDQEAEAAKVIQEAVQPLINEVRSSFDYLMASDQHVQVTRLALSGGGSLLPGLSGALRAQLGGIDVIAADPTVRLRDKRRHKDDSPERFHATAAVAIGLALGPAR